MRWTVPVPMPSDLATFKIVLGWQITADPVGSPRHQRPLGARRAQRKQEGGKGVIANGGRFRRRRLPKFLNENNAPLAVTTAEWTGLDDGNVTMPA